MSDDNFDVEPAGSDDVAELESTATVEEQLADIVATIEELRSAFERALDALFGENVRPF
jgi:hypothetical protein